MKIEMEVEENAIPEGWRVVRFGKPKNGEHFIEPYYTDKDRRVIKAQMDFKSYRVIVEKA